jgi:hypothetical protein
MRRSELTDAVLRKAVGEMVEGLVDADLGGHLFKKRVALPGQGKRGGARTIVATRRTGQWFFVFGFGKSERANIDDNELKVLREMAKTLLELEDRQLAEALTAGEIMEVSNDD